MTRAGQAHVIAAPVRIRMGHRGPFADTRLETVGHVCHGSQICSAGGVFFFDDQHYGSIGRETRLASANAGGPDRYEIEIGSGASELTVLAG